MVHDDSLLARFSDRVLPVLGLWHPGKQAALDIFTRFHGCLWAPALFAISQRKSYRTRKLQFVLNFLAHLTTAYPLFKVRFGFYEVKLNSLYFK
jgi:hypothetical protein